MAESLDDEIRISEKTLMAPLVLAKNLEEVYNVAMKISASKGVETSINKNVTATKKLRDETAKLNTDTTALVAAQKQLSKAIEEDAKAYAIETEVINKLNSTTQTQLSNSDKQVKEMKKRRDEVNANRAALAKLSAEEVRASKEGQELLATIQKQDAELAKLRAEVEKNNKENAKQVNGVSALKKQYKELQSQLLAVGEEFGVESEQFAKVAKEAGDVKDQIGDLAEATSAVSGEPIERLSGSFDLFKGKLSALDLKGATNGIKGIIGASKDLTFKSAINGAGGLTKAVGALGKALLTNPIFLIAAIVIGIGVAIYALKDKVKVISAAFDAMGEAIDWVVQKGKDFLDFIGLTTFALDDMTVKVVEDLEKQRKKWEELYDDQIKLLTAAGKSTTEAEKAKQKAIADTTAAAIAQYDKQKREGSELTEDQIKNLDELVKANHDANIELVAIALRTQKEKEDLAKEEAKKAKEARLREEGDAFKLQQFLLQNEIEKNKKIASDESKTFDARMDAIDQLIAKQKELALLEMDQEFNAEGATPSARKLAEAKLQQDLNDIAEEAGVQRLAIIKSNQDQELKNTQEYVSEQKAEAEKNLQNDINDLNSQLDEYKKFLIAKGLTKEEADKLLLVKQKQVIEDTVNAEIDAQRKILDIDHLSKEDQAAAEQKLFELKMKLTDLYYDNLQGKEEDWKDKLKKFIGEWGQVYAEFSSSVGDLFAANTAKRLQKLDEESDALNEQRDLQIAASKDEQDAALKRAGDNAELQQQIKEAYAIKDASLKEQYAKREEQLEKKRRQEVRKQAQLDKAIALSVGAIKLAEAILAMLTVGPAGFALSVAAAAIGAIQLATIAAQPIPAAEKGIRGHKGGKILAGEKGHELIEMPGNRLALTDNKPTLYDLPAGTNIYPHTDPRSINAVAGKTLPIYRQQRQAAQRDPELVNTMKQAVRAIKAKPVVIVRGVIEGSKVHNTYIQQCKNG